MAERTSRPPCGTEALVIPEECKLLQAFLRPCILYNAGATVGVAVSGVL